jgi:threonine dehydratase
VVDRADVEAAAARLAGLVRRTPVVELDVGDRAVTLKLELLQHTGSFKARGALNRLLTAASPGDRVIAASGGNHGLAVAWAARQLGMRAEVYVPDPTPAVKVDRLREYGAHVVVGGAFYADALAASAARAAETGALVVHAYDDPEVVAGQGTVAVELTEQVPDVDVVVVAVGGGGLVGGITTWLTGSRARVVAVEPERIPTLHAALAAGRPVDVDVGGVAADSLGARRIGGHGFDAAVAGAVDAVLVPDDAIVAARRWLWNEARIAAEPGGATALAALLTGAHRPRLGERTAVVVCGGNADPTGF